jgi:ADP-glucose pyrophosphorylase
MFYLLVVLYILAIIDGFHINQNIATYMVVNRKTTRERNIKFYEKMMKCDYANTIFPFEPKTCSKQPNNSYMSIYEKTYKMELWEYQQKECLQKVNLYGFFMGLFIISLMLLFNIICEY